jgi:hypothetical protein
MCWAKCGSARAIVRQGDAARGFLHNADAGQGSVLMELPEEAFSALVAAGWLLLLVNLGAIKFL